MSIYKIDLERAIKSIKDGNAKKVLLQLPDGLKPEAKKISDEIKKETGVEVLIWSGSNFGACDLPSGLDNMRIDLLLHFGHSKWIVN